MISIKILLAIKNILELDLSQIELDEKSNGCGEYDYVYNKATYEDCIKEIGSEIEQKKGFEALDNLMDSMRTKEEIEMMELVEYMGRQARKHLDDKIKELF